MSSIGFGLERLGLVALSRPRIFGALLLIATLVLGVFLPSVKFNGSITSVIPRTAEQYVNYVNHHRDFRNFSRDIAVIVRSPRLDTAEGLEALRELQIELSISEGASAAFSMFSVPIFNERTGEIERFFPPEIETDAAAQDLLKRLVEQYPQASNLVSGEEKAALLLVALDLETLEGSDKASHEAFRSIVETVEEYKADDFEVLYAGLTPISITLLDTLVQDQFRLTLLGLLVGAIVALVFFRCVASAVLCAIPPILTAVWSISIFGLLNVPITYLTTILPTLALILAYADGIVLHHRWMKLNRDGGKGPEKTFAHLRDAISRVGPASALTSVTTAIALATFMFSSSEALQEFGQLGVLLVLIAFVSVIIALPVIGYGFAKMKLFRFPREKRKPALIGKVAARLYSSAPGLLTLAGLVGVVIMGAAHFKLEPNYRVIEYLPQQSETLEAENLANEVFGGRSLVFVSIPVVEEGGVSSRANRARLGEITEVLVEAYSERQVLSMYSFLNGIEQEKADGLAEQLQNASDEIRQGYISRDDKRLLVSLRIPSNRSIRENAELLKELEETLAPLPYAEELIITGFPVLLATEFSAIINELRSALLFAIAVGIVLIGFATRSLFFAAAAAVPNLFPVLFVEAMIYVKSGVINITEVIALTIAFGIAIDNAVHIINALQAERRLTERSVGESLKVAILEVAPALAGSTLIICLATSVILTSILPILTIVGTLIIVILIVALATNLVLLPANIVTLAKVFKG